METVKNKSESPFSRDKGNTQVLENPENADVIIEQLKTKKKSKRNKQKTEVNGKADSAKNANGNGNDFLKEEVLNQNQIEDNGDDNDNDNENVNVNVIDTKKKNSKTLADINEENDSTNSMPELVEELPFEIPSKDIVEIPQEEFIIEESTQSEEVIIDTDQGIEINVENGNNCSSLLNETDDCAKKDVPETEDSVLPDNEGINNGIDENSCNEVNGVSVSSTQDQENGEGNFSVDEMLENSTNDSNNESWFKETDTTKESVQGTPDTPAKEDNSFSNKISSFLGKWNSSLSPEQKQDSEISSSKKPNTSKEPVLSHPYLSKVSGRPGIRGGLSSSSFSLASKHDDMKTPKSSEVVLNDSFRVRTDPSRLSSSGFQENPTLRKYKGKRCLNANDDPTDEDDDEIFSSSSKKRKLEDNKTSDSGFFGNILWSPFRKKSLDGEESVKLTTTESKLSRFLSPFWFWKKTATVQKGQ